MRTSLAVIAVSALCACALSQNEGGESSGDPLTFSFSKRYGQVEVGGPYVGAEFHESMPLPSRISFFSPVANSIDLSTDYWERWRSRPFVVGLQVDGGPRKLLGRTPWMYLLSPHRVTFNGEESGIVCTMTYEFCLHAPAMVFTFKVRNPGNHAADVNVYTHLKTTLRTCQTYARLDSGWSTYDPSLGLVTVNFDRRDCDSASVLVENVGVAPAQWTSDARELAISDTGSSSWLAPGMSLSGKAFSRERPGITTAAFVFSKHLRPGDSLAVIQVVASCRQADAGEVGKHLRTSWAEEVGAYDRYVRTRGMSEGVTTTGDPVVDRSAVWARALLATNAHFLHGEIVPMPCPAEYNFFFTHDALLTDLAAVNFDVRRVKKDLLYLQSLSVDRILPHAYYWRDDGYMTEFCTPDNWNHLWFVLVAGGYLRHTGDRLTVNAIYPMLEKSIEQVLQQCREDHLMYAFRPDWWDIGHREGSRSYITILTIRALREFLYLSSALHRFSGPLMKYEDLADAMEAALDEKLWDESSGYLMNYNGELLDRHYYMGSLLAAPFGFLSPEKTSKLVATASRILVDDRIGVRTVMPPDFNRDSVRAFFRFVGNEAGDPFLYANGGVWPHANAFYTAALLAVNRPREARRFFETTMTLDGIANSPMGLPAMYEYRYSDPASPQFGKIDKPSFLWAGGFYLSTLYRLMGVTDNEWNISIGGPVAIPFDHTNFRLHFLGDHVVAVRAHGTALSSFLADGTSLPSCVLPLDIGRTGRWELGFGQADRPYLERVNAILSSARFDSNARRLTCTLSSFAGHRVSARIVVRGSPVRILLDGKTLAVPDTVRRPDGMLMFDVRFNGSAEKQTMEIQF